MRYLKSHPANDFKVYSFSTITDIDYLIKDLFAFGINIVRDVIIDSHPAELTNRKETLKAQHGIFNYHSDGVFLPTPPKFVLIQLLQPNPSGLLSLVDMSFFDKEKNAEYFFGVGEEGVKARLFQDGIFRYRKDYMTPLEGGDILLHDYMKEYCHQYKSNTIQLGKGECLLIDNHKYLHARSAFKGRRLIRRLWAD